MGRMTFVFRRLLQLVPVAIGCTILVFFMIHLIPGDPARTILGIHATPRTVALLHQQWGLNRPLISQYWLFLDRLLHGNLGTSLYYGGSAADAFMAFLYYSPYAYATTSSVHGFFVTPLGNYHMENVWLSK